MRYQCLGGPWDGRDYELRDGCLAVEVPEMVDAATGQPIALRGAVWVPDHASYPETRWALHRYELVGVTLRYRGLR